MIGKRVIEVIWKKQSGSATLLKQGNVSPYRKKNKVCQGIRSDIGRKWKTSFYPYVFDNYKFKQCFEFQFQFKSIQLNIFFPYN